MQLAQEGPRAVASPFRFRILAPALAHAVGALAKNHTGTWDPLLFGFLVANSIFVATTAYLISVIGESLLADSSTALFAAALYLLNFAVSNALIWRRWWTPARLVFHRVSHSKKAFAAHSLLELFLLAVVACSSISVGCRCPCLACWAR